MYKVGDLVKLPSVRPFGWNSSGQMDEFLGKEVVITYISRDGDRFTFKENTNEWIFQISEIVDFVDPDMKKLRIEELKTLDEKCKYSLEDIKKIAEEIYGEKRVEVTSFGEEVYTIVHFPEFTITNSKGHSHIIKDLYVRITLSDVNLFGDIKASIKIEGCRTTYEYKEYKSRYRHSHLHPGNFLNFTDFCLGSSDFRMIIENLKLTLSEEDWYLLFYSLENFVKWESLEGGPYIRMSNITSSSTQISPSIINEEVERLIEFIPEECFTFTDKIELIENHPSLTEFYNKNSKLRKIQINSQNVPESELKSIQQELDDGKLNFNGTDVRFKVYVESSEEKEDDGKIDSQLISSYNNLIKLNLEDFNKKAVYDNFLSKNYKSFIGEIGIEQ